MQSMKDHKMLAYALLGSMVVCAVACVPHAALWAVYDEDLKVMRVCERRGRRYTCVRSSLSRRSTPTCSLLLCPTTASNSPSGPCDSEALSTECGWGIEGVDLYDACWTTPVPSTPRWKWIGLRTSRRGLPFFSISFSRIVLEASECLCSRGMHVCELEPTARLELTQQTMHVCARRALMVADFVGAFIVELVSSFLFYRCPGGPCLL